MARRLVYLYPWNRVQTDGNPPIPESGTPIADYNTTMSVVASDGEAGPRTWGGARNYRDRRSDALTLKQVTDIEEAAHFAWRIGRPLNRHITIHLESAGVPDASAASKIGAFMKLASDWLRTLKAPFAWIWVREGGVEKGSHVHILAYVPPELGPRFGNRQRAWLKRVTGRRYKAGVIKTTRIGGNLNAASAAPAHYRKNLWQIVAYNIKGVSPDVARTLRLSRIEAGGSIIGKRTGTSQNISAAARSKYADMQAARRHKTGDP